MATSASKAQQRGEIIENGSKEKLITAKGKASNRAGNEM